MIPTKLTLFLTMQQLEISLLMHLLRVFITVLLLQQLQHTVELISEQKLLSSQETSRYPVKILKHGVVKSSHLTLLNSVGLPDLEALSWTMLKSSAVHNMTLKRLL